MSDKHKKIAAIAYAILLVGGFFYVRHVLKTEDVQVTPVEKEEKGEEQPKPATVTLWLQNDSEITSRTFVLSDGDSISELLEKARADGFIYFETVKYLDKNEIWFNGQTPMADSSWRVFYKEVDVTAQMYSTYLVHGGSYTLKKVSLVP